MAPSVSVVTSTVPERASMLAECKASFADFGWQHCVYVDEDRKGPAHGTNEAAKRATGDWLLPLADDDFLHPDFWDVMQQFLVEGDIVYSWCHTTSSEWCPNMLFSERVLRMRNFIPATAFIRRELWESLGGYRDCVMEDWDFWKRALDVGARFVCVPEVLWTFRIHDGNFFTLKEERENG